MDQNTLLKISLQRALVGTLIDSIVGVTARIQDSLITVIIYFNCDISDVEEELTGEITTEVVADFPNTKIIERAVSVTKEQMVALDFWAILRAGYKPVYPGYQTERKSD